MKTSSVKNNFCLSEILEKLNGVCNLVAKHDMVTKKFATFTEN